MKKLLLIILLFMSTHRSEAVIRVTYFDVVAAKMIIHNYCACSYDYSLFQLSINNNVYTLNNLTLAWGVLYMAAAQNACFIGVNLPSSAADFGGGGASIGLWYPNSLPANPTTANLVAFLQYGSGGHEYESVAVAAGMWTAGQYINVPPPVGFTGGMFDYGPSFYSTTTGIVSYDGVEGISLHPNPASEKTFLTVPDDLSNTPMHVTIYNLSGEAVLRSPFRENEIDCRMLPVGVYTIELSDYVRRLATLQLIRN